MRVIGLGAGGHAKVVIEILRQMTPKIEVVGLLDIDTSLHGREVAGVLVLGDDRRLPGLFQDEIRHAFVGIGSVGNARPRHDAYQRLVDYGFEVVTARHPSAIVAASARIGQGATIMAGAIINAEALLGNNVIVNTGAIIEHDCQLEDHVHVATGAKLAGGVFVGESTHIGIGASVREGVRIGRGAVVGAGAVVVKDVPGEAVVVGVPARALRSEVRT